MKIFDSGSLFLEKEKTPALTYHRYPVPGKFSTVPCKPLRNPEDLALAYSPGVAEACLSIAEHPEKADLYTNRQHLVAVISNGTAVLGLGDIGPLASKPVMEGKAVLFQHFAKLNAIDLEIDENDPEKLVNIIASLAPSFGGINLEDIKAPECFYIEEQLIQRLKIPVFHDDQHGTAITVSAALTNALYLIQKSLDQVKCVVLGAGAGALACLKLLVELGMDKKNIFVYDTKGLICTQRTDLSSHKAFFAQKTDAIPLEEALRGADVFLGLSKANALSKEMVKNMAPSPVIFALANPIPEIWPQDVYEVVPDALVGTGRSDLPNQVNNVLCFPYIFRGALDTKASQINLAMKKACVKALAELARSGDPENNLSFGSAYFLPKPFDPRLLVELSSAVAKAAVESGVAQGSFCLDTYKKSLIQEAHGTPSAERDLKG